jgi:hypothetical protein
LHQAVFFADAFGRHCLVGGQRGDPHAHRPVLVNGIFGCAYISIRCTVDFCRLCAQLCVVSEGCGTVEGGAVLVGVGAALGVGRGVSGGAAGPSCGRRRRWATGCVDVGACGRPHRVLVCRGPQWHVARLFLFRFAAAPRVCVCMQSNVLHGACARSRWRRPGPGGQARPGGWRRGVRRRAAVHRRLEQRCRSRIVVVVVVPLVAVLCVCVVY